MKKLLTIVALTATALADPSVHDEEMKELWSAWKDLHNKNYDDDEEPNRMDIFVKNHHKIKAHNEAGDSTVTLGLNHFADLTPDEFKAQFSSGFVPPVDNPEEDGSVEGEENKRFLSSLPASVDWRAKGAVTPIKNQKQCNGCWSFSTAGALESLHFIKTGSLVSFSEQQLLDCDTKSHGCKSGNMPSAYTYTASHGIEKESTYPFVQKVTSCTYSSSKATKVNKGFVTVKSRNPTALMTALVNQPVSVAVDAAQSVWQFYKSGVITSGCGTTLDHAVLAVGYTTVNGVKAIIVKNSWGTGWGEQGYVYLSSSTSLNGGAGACGVLSFPLYPTA